MKITEVMDLVLDKPIADEKDVDPKELAMGIEVEFEHTSNREAAKKIALAHLLEFKKGYYKGLIELEKRLKKDNKESK